jgi:mRNA interferase RelE/StbE
VPPVTEGNEWFEKSGTMREKGLDQSTPIGQSGSYIQSELVNPIHAAGHPTTLTNPKLTGWGASPPRCKEMKYTSELKPKAIKDLKSIPLKERERILGRIEWMEDDLQGDVKKLTNHTPEYRMRSGNYRVLFEIEEGKIVVYRVLHRKEAYL